MSKSTRSSSQLLPQIFQTEKNKRFINSTIDQLIEPSVLDRLSAYIGQRYKPSYRTTDIYLEESSLQRQSYQLEPTVTYKTDGSNIDFASQYIDAVNEIKAQGGSNEKHDRLWEQESYSYAPPVDPDKLVNYRQYYWMSKNLSPIILDVGPGTTSRISVVNNALGAYVFSNKIDQDNPDIIVYKGSTYEFSINAPGHPFYIKTQYGTGSSDQVSDEHVTNNGAMDGIVTLKVPSNDSSSNIDTVLFYQCGNHVNMKGRIIVKDLDLVDFDPSEAIEGSLKFTDANGLTLTDTVNIQINTGVTSSYINKKYFVDGVGESISLTDIASHEVVESYGTETGEVWDENGVIGFDTTGFDNSVSESKVLDYFTINRSSQDLNAWSRANRWTHIDAIKLTETHFDSTITLTEDIRAKRPIVEFLPNLELFNHGNNGRLVDVIDTTTTDALSNVQGQAGYFADTAELKKGDTIIFTADQEQQRKIFTVDFVQVANELDSTTVIQLILSETLTAQEMLSVVSRKGSNKGVTYHVENGLWTKSQQKTKVNQKPKFDVFDADQVSLGNLTTYPSTNFTGSTLFEVATDTQGTPDTVYGTNVIYERLGLINDIRLQDTFNSDKVQFVDAGNIVERSIRQYHFNLYKKGSTVAIVTNNWKKYAVVANQKIIKVYENNTNQHYFEVDHYKNPQTLTDLTVQVLKNGDMYTDYVLENINTKIYVKTNDVMLTDDVITVKAHSSVGTPSGFGFFEVPVSLQRNAQNKNVTQFTLGDMVKHYRLGVNDMTDFVGTANGPNNSRDLSNVFGHSSLMMQHSGNDPLAHILVKDKVLNLAKAMRFAGKEYEKVKQNIIERLNEVSSDFTVQQNLDNVLELINQNKTNTMPFFDSDMLGAGNTKSITKYTVIDDEVINYPISFAHNLTTLSKKAIYVYLNDVQLVHGLDYEFTATDDSSNQDGIEVKTTLAPNDILQIVEYDSTDSNFIPATPTKLGLAPAYQPSKYTDDTYQPSTDVIRGHDGAITIAYGDYRDNILLEFEKRIYNNIKTSYLDETIDIDYGYYKSNEYTAQEVLDLFAKDFFSWSGTFAVDYSTNDTYSATNDLTWNFSSYINRLDNSALPGYWRGIYKQFFNTDQPHTHPWEIFDFTIKPDWWDTRYGASPYTKGNLLLWDDVASGFIAQGSRKGYYTKYAKPNVIDILPIDDSGNLLSPMEAGFLNTGYVVDADHQKNWNYGDYAPAESAWRRSSSYLFAEQVAKFLAKPSKYAGIWFDTSRSNKNNIGQWVYNGLYRQDVTNYIIPSSTVQTAGYINAISDYIKHLGYTANTYISDRFNNIAVQLSYKLGGFTNKDNLQVAVGSVSPQSTSQGVFLPRENFNILIYKSAPVVTAHYSGVIVQKTGTGFKVSGYSNFDRTFKYYKPKQFSNSSTIRIGATTESFTEWQAGGFYNKGVIVRNESVFYRSLNTITSGQNFDATNWSEIGATLPLKGGVSVKKYKNYEPTITTVPYGQQFNTAQDTADFLFGYAQHLEIEGFVFDDFVNELQQPANWDLSVKEFLFWTTQGWNTDSVITLSPSAQSLTFQKENTIGDDLTDTDQFYSVLQQDGLPINPNNFTTNRQDGVFRLVTNPAEDGIYNADIRAVQKEHLVVFDNISQFSDVIFDDITGNRQDRIKLVGFRTANWNGDLYAPGYVLDRAKISDWTPFTDYRIGENVVHQGKYYAVTINHTSGETFERKFYQYKEEAPEKQMLPNWDAKAEAFRDFYSLDSDNFDSEQQRYAQHLIAYQPRQYMNNLGLEELTQFKFYQGMLKEKGTIGPINKFKSQPQSDQDVSYDLFEEYAFRVGEYGGYRTQQAFAFVVPESKHIKDRLVYKVSEDNLDDTETVININQQSDELLLKPYAFDGSINQTIDYNQHQNTIDSIFQLPSAGYVLPNQVNYTVFDESELLNLDATQLKEGQTVWVANTPTGDWDVKRFNSVNTSTEAYKQFDDVLQITTKEPHGLNENDYVAIFDVNDSIDGVYQVLTADSTDDDRSFTVAFSGTVDSTNLQGTIGKFGSVRINKMDDINTILPTKDFAIGDYVYVDNDYKKQYPDNGLWKVYQKSQSTEYSISDETLIEEEQASGEMGSAIAVDDSNLYLASTAPGVNKTFVYIRNSTADSFYLRNSILLDIGNSDADDRFGHSIAMVSDGARIFAGSPQTADIVKLTLSATFRAYTRGTTVLGSVSGATGKILDVDWDNDIIWVKNTAATNFQSEPLDVGDSSSTISVTKVEGSDATSQGAVHWINRDARSSYGITQTIVAPNVDKGGEFGSAVAVSGDGTYLAIGAPGGPDDSTAADRGTVYVYKYAKDGSSTRYDLHQTLVPTASSQLGSRFGEQVEISNDGKTIIISSPKQDNDSTTNDGGRVYVFRLKNDVFYEHESLTANLIDDIQFGTSLAISSDGTDVLVGAPLYSGAVRKQGGVFHFTKNTFTAIGDGSTTQFDVGFTVDHNEFIGVFVGNDNYAHNDGNDSSTTNFYRVDGSTNSVTLSSAPASGSTVVITQYTLTDTITVRSSHVNQQFGKNVTVKDNNMMAQSIFGDAKLSTTFDRLATDGSTVLSETTFDAGTTSFVDVQNDSGQVHVFNKINLKFIAVQNIRPSQTLPSGADYGSAIAFSKLNAYIGASGLDGSLSGSGRFFIFKKITDSLGWETIATQPSLVDVNKIEKAFLYDTSTNRIVNQMPIIDPIKGKLFAEVRKNINFEIAFDPAEYDSWDEDHLGEIWLDISTFKYFWYEQGSDDDKLNNWAKLHPSSDVQVKEWISSSLTPTQYNAVSNTNEGQSQNITGTANNTFVTKRVYDENKSRFVNKYFYWVSNSTSLGNNNTLSALEIANSLTNPTLFSNNFAGFVSKDSIILNLNRNQLAQNSIALQFENTTDSEPIHKHTEHVLIAKDDANSAIPQSLTDKFFDSLIGFDKFGRTVPDVNQPPSLRYGTLNRPRQSWYPDRIGALKIIVQFVNDQLKTQAYATTKDLSLFNKIDPLPSLKLGEYDKEVDTDTDLTYVNTNEISIGYKILVIADTNVDNGWAVYQWTGDIWDRTLQQTYDTKKYWSFADWYAEGYSINTVADHLVTDERTRLNGNYSKGDIVKVKQSYGGEFRLYLKTSSSFETVGIENGTLELSTSLFDYSANQIGFGADAYGADLYDAEAVTELRNILDAVKNFAIDEDAILYNKLFFIGVRIAQLQNKNLDWAFKTSFVKAINTYSNLQQLREFQIDTADAVNDFFREVLPFKTTVREDVTSYLNKDTVAGDFTDFDNRTYYNKDTATYETPNINPSQTDLPSIYDTYPWKEYANNFKLTVGSIVVDRQGDGYTEVPTVTITGGGGTGAKAVATIGNGKITEIKVTNAGTGYVSIPTVSITGGGGASIQTTALAHAELVNNKVRSVDTTIKFDRLNSLRETQSNTIVEWSKYTSYTAGQNVRYLDKIYRVHEPFTSGDKFGDNVLLPDSSSATSQHPLVEWSATDRIHAYYDPSAGMAGLIGDGSTTNNAYAQLMTGIEYPGVRVQALTFSESSGYDIIGYDNTEYDTNVSLAEATDPVNLDQVLDSKSFTTSLGTRAEDINVVGDDFISEYSAHGPEEVLPGGVYDTLDLKVYTRQTDSASNIFKKRYSGDGSTVGFTTPELTNTDGLRVYVNNIFKIQGTDYTVNFATNKITFTTAPSNNDIIEISVIEVSTNSLLGRFEFTGDASTVDFATTVNSDLITQTYVLVNGVKTTTTKILNEDSVTALIRFSSAPVDGAKIEVYLFDLPVGTKAFSEVVTTQYTDIPTDSSRFEIQIDPVSLVTGPYHHKVIVEGVAGSNGTNRYRLDPPQIAYYEGDASTTSFIIPTEPVSSALANITDTEVFKNGIKLTPGEDFTIGSNALGNTAAVLSVTPAVGDVIAVIYLSGHDYTLDGNGKLVLQSGWNDDSSIDAETIFVTTFSNHDTQSLRTELFSGSTGDVTTLTVDRGLITASPTTTEDFGDLDTGDQFNQDLGFTSGNILADDIDAKKYELSKTPLNSSFVFVTVNKQYLTANIDYVLEGNQLFLPQRSLGLSDVVTVTYISGTIQKNPIAYRVFKDIINRYHYKRISSAHSTVLKAELSKDATEILVEDATVLGTPNTDINTPGVIFIGTERIAYFEKDGNTLKRLYRGTFGTAVQTHALKSKIVDASGLQSMPYEDTTATTTFTGDGTTVSFALSYLPSAKEDIVVTIGGAKSTAFSIGSDSTTAVILDSAPSVGVQVDIIRKTGLVWYDQGTTSASNGLGLQQATGVEIAFLQEKPADISLI